MVEIILDAPGKNALSLGLMQQLLDQLRQAAGEPVLLYGAGDAFSAGLNLKELSSLDGPGIEAFVRRLEELVATLWLYPGPTAAAVNGHAIAGGSLLALCCDVRVVSADGRVRMGLNEVALGLELPPGCLKVVRAMVPPHRLTELLLGAALHLPEDAVRLGLVDFTAEDPVAAARHRLEVLARHPRDAYAATKRSLRAPALGPQDEATLQAVLAGWISPTLKERIAAVLKR